MAQDDAGAQEAYERELDEEEDIRRMDAEAAVRRAQGATHASDAAGSSSSATPAQSSAGEPLGTRAMLLRALLHAPTVWLECKGYSGRVTIDVRLYTGSILWWEARESQGDPAVLFRSVDCAGVNPKGQLQLVLFMMRLLVCPQVPPVYRTASAV